MKITEAIKRQVRRELAATGGRARARKYSRAQLSAWSKLGGRPRKRKGGKP
jgi:hypothetical protein